MGLHPNFSALRRLGFDHPILISCGTLALGYAVVRRALSPRMGDRVHRRVCIVHPGFVLQTKVDWGPVVLMLFSLRLTNSSG